MAPKVSPEEADNRMSEATTAGTEIELMSNYDLVLRLVRNSAARWEFIRLVETDALVPFSEQMGRV